jgi:hypothetical protein
MPAFQDRTPAPTPANGPFSQTEVSIYCDESGHEGQRSQQYMVIDDKLAANLALQCRLKTT